MPKSAGLFLPISPASISTWIIFALLLNVLPKPLYKLSLIPSIIIRSALPVISLNPLGADGLAAPRQYSFSSEMIPLPRLSVNVGIPLISINSFSISEEPEYHVPLPARTTGFLAFDNNSNATDIESESGST